MEDTELNPKTIIFKIQVSVTNYDNQNNIISVIGGASDKIVALTSIRASETSLL